LNKNGLTNDSFSGIILPLGIKGVTMVLKTRVFNLYVRNYKNLTELAGAMEISVSQVYRVLEGKRNINRKFIIGAIKAFPGHKFDDLFYFIPEVPVGKTPRVQQLEKKPESQPVSMVGRP
jgi:hypothetical protein